MANFTLNDLNMPAGKKARLHRLMYEYGPGNGKLMILPIDQGLEHGPVGFFGPDNTVMDCANPEFQFKLALEGKYSAIAVHYGLAEKYYSNYAGKVPLVLKINGKTSIPSDDEAFSPLTSTVEDAVRLGADAIGYTLFVGTPQQDRDIRQFMEVRREAEKLGMPIILWAYPRGTFVSKTGGKNSLFAIDYAARVGCELGADVVKVNFPETTDSLRDVYPAPYNKLQLDDLARAKKVVDSAGKTFVIFSGGAKVSREELHQNVHTAFQAGGVGLIFGRNMWKNPMDEALTLTSEVKEIMSKY